jgi:hypothetical protein
MHGTTTISLSGTSSASEAAIDRLKLVRVNFVLQKYVFDLSRFSLPRGERFPQERFFGDETVPKWNRMEGK